MRVWGLWTSQGYGEEANRVAYTWACGGTQSWRGSSSRSVIYSINLIKMQALLYRELVRKGNEGRGSVSYQTAQASDVLFQKPLAPGWCSVSASLSEDGGMTSRHCKGPSCLDWTGCCETSSRRETCEELNLRSQACWILKPRGCLTMPRKSPLQLVCAILTIPTVMPVWTQPFHREFMCFWIGFMERPSLGFVFNDLFFPHTILD